MISLNDIPPKKIPNLETVVNQLVIIQDRLCGRCGQWLVDLPYPHHGLAHNKQENRRRFPLLIHNIVNLFLLCDKCHSQYGMYLQIQNLSIIDEIEKIIKEEYYEMSIKELSLFKCKLLNKYVDYINWQTY